MKIIQGLFLLALGLAFVGVMSLLAAVVMFFLWNWLMPELFNLKEVTYWQAWGLCFLCSMLFKGGDTVTSK